MLFTAASLFCVTSVVLLAVLHNRTPLACLQQLVLFFHAGFDLVCQVLLALASIFSGLLRLGSNLAAVLATLAPLRVYSFWCRSSYAIFVDIDNRIAAHIALGVGGLP